MKKLSYDRNGAMTVLKILSNENRYSIMALVINAKNDYCVHELAKAVGISQSAASHQLAYLEAHGVVKSVRTGKTKCYLPTISPMTERLAKVINAFK